MKRFYFQVILILFTFCFSNAQQTYTFTTAGAQGNVGPTIGQINNAYNNTNLNGQVVLSPQGPGIQRWIVPVTGTYTIEANGAAGGNTINAPGGRGRSIAVEVVLNAGDEIDILVGQRGGRMDFQTNSGAFRRGSAGGGGGGTFIINATTNTPILIAGGGGGAATSQFYQVAVLPGRDANGGTSGAPGINGPYSWSPAGNGGSGGTGGLANGGGSGGGGFLGNGTLGSFGGFPGISYQNGGTGGLNRVRPLSWCFYQGLLNIQGGFGGGAGAGNYCSYEVVGGGGGGYSGGGGAGARQGAGGGGASFISGTLINNSLNPSEDGQVTLTITQPLGIFPDLANLPDIIEQCESTLIAPTANSGAITATADVSFPITTQGTTVVTWTYNDNGNTVTQTQNVILADTTAPSISGCDNINATTDLGACTADLTIVPPVISDNCNLGNSALDFDGSNDRVVIPTSPSLSFSTEMTLQAWIYPEKNTYSRIISNYQGGGTSNGEFVFDTYDPTAINGRALRFETINGAVIGISVPNVLTLGTWNHVAVTFNNGEIKLFVDGNIVGSTTVASTNLAIGGKDFILGEDRIIGVPEYFDGAMDEVQIWNRALTESEIASNKNYILTGNESGLVAYYNFEDGTGSATLSDVSSNGNNGNLSNMDPASDWVNSNAPVSPVNLINDITGTADASSIYPIGPTTVTWTATDGSGNQVTCEQLIVVESPFPAIDEIVPGTFSPGDQVVINGNNFTDLDNVVTMDGVETPIVSQSATSITVTAPADICSGDIIVTNACAFSSNALTYTVNAPIINAFTPNDLSTLGNQVITLDGSDFNGNSTVTIGGQVGLNVIVLDANTITFETPANLCDGTIEVTSCGQVSNSLPYNMETPTIVAINPNILPASGGAQVVIDGAGFSASGNTVTFDGISANVISENYNSITVESPADICDGEIIVTNNCNGVSNSIFYNINPPTISALTPSEISTSGGDLVTLNGSDFNSNSAVTIGGQAGLNVIVVDSNTITFETPANLCDGTIEVTSCGQVSNNVLYNMVEPTIASINPNILPNEGGAQVVINGTGFSASGNTVTFDGIPGVNIQNESFNSITVTSPPGLCGGIIEVINACGAIAIQAYNVNAPVITAINQSPVVPGSALIIDGANFNPGQNQVTVNGIDATISFESFNQIEVTVPNLNNACDAEIIVTTCSLISNSFASPATELEAPIPDLASLPDVNDQCEVAVLTEPTATDNCSSTVIVTNNANLPITTLGTTVVTWTYDDGNGNISTQTQNVIIGGSTTLMNSSINDGSFESNTVFSVNASPTTLPPVWNINSSIPGRGGILSNPPHNAVLAGADGSDAIFADNDGATPNVTTATSNNLLGGNYSNITEGDIFTWSFIVNSWSANSSGSLYLNFGAGNILIGTGIASDQNLATFNTISGTYTATAADAAAGSQLQVVFSIETGTGGTYGNVYGDNVQLSVLKSQSPIITCPSDITVNTYVNSNTGVATYNLPTAIDTCDGNLSVNQTAGLAPGSSFPLGTTVNTFETIDSSGNTATCSLTVTVVDNENPVVTCPTNIDATATSANGAIVNFTTSSTDNVGVESTTLVTSPTTGLLSGDTFPIGTTAVTYTAIDAAGNSSECSFDVVVTGLAPDIVCPGNITQDTDPNTCTAVVNFTATDNVGIPASTITYSQDPGTVFPLGITTVTATATNAVSTSTCTFQVIVEDNEAPTLSQNTALVDYVSNCDVAIPDLTGYASDNCSANFTQSPNAASLISGLNIGDTIEVTIFDENENGTPFTLTVSDQTSPVLNPNSQVIDFASNCEIEIPNIIPFATDNCPVGLTQNPAAGALIAASDGDTIVILVTDSNGNSSPYTLTVSDTTAPNAVCNNNLVVELDANGNGTLTAAQVDGGSTDNCGIASISIDNTSFTCNDIGNSEDDCGGTSESTITDCTSRYFDFPNNAYNNFEFFITTTENQVLADLNIGLTFELYSLTNYTISITSPQGTTRNVFTRGLYQFCSYAPYTEGDIILDDESTNTTNCSGSFFGFALGAFEGENYAGTWTVNLQAFPLPSSWGFDDPEVILNMCLIPTFCEATSGGPDVTLTVTDVNGNVSTCTAPVTVVDNIAPNVVCNPIDVELDATGNYTLTQADIDAMGAGSTDACGIASIQSNITSFNCSNVGPNDVTLTVTDINGNTATCVAIVNVADNTAPDAVCVSDIVVQLDASGNGTLTAAQVDGGSTDNCGIASISIDKETFDCTDVSGGAPTPRVWLNELHYDNASGDVNEFVEVAGTAGFDLTGYYIEFYNGSTGAIYTPTVSLSGTIDDEGAGYGAVSYLRSSIQNGDPDGLALVDNNGNVVEFWSYEGTFTATNGSANGMTSTDMGVSETSTTPIGDSLQRTGDETSSWAGPSNDSPGDLNAGQTLSSGSSPIVTLTVTDQNGNSSTCTATVTVVDNIAPAVACNPIDVELDASGNYTLSQTDIDNMGAGSSDACGIASIQSNITSFNCSNVGPNDVTLTVTDNNGNTATCVAIVNVEDNTAPDAVCASDIVVQLDASGNGTLTVAEVDGGSTDNCGVANVTIDNSSFTCNDIGGGSSNPSVTESFEDWSDGSYGGTSNATLASGMWESNNALTGDYAYSGSRGVRFNDDSGENEYLLYKGLDGNGKDGGLGTISFWYRHWDGDGSNVEFQVQYNQSGAGWTNVGPVVNAPSTTWMQFSESPNITGDDILVRIISIDDAERISFDDFSMSDASSGPAVTLTVTDVNGNVSTCTAPVTVLDNILPTVVCNSITVELDATGSYTLSSSDVDTIANGSTDGCGIASLSVSPDSFTCGEIGVNTVTLTVTDNNGNVNNCTTTVNVVDTTAPFVVCNDITVQLDANGSATISAADIDGGSTDTCSPITLSINQNTFDCTDVNATVSINDLFFSEYVEGSSSNKYIEIYNGTGGPINLSDYQLRLYSNGNVSPNTTNTLSGTIADGESKVYRNSGANIYGGASTIASAVNWNGNDAIELYKISTGSSVDIFGTIGEDPGSEWNVDGNETQNHTLRRNITVVRGNTINTPGFTTLGTEWTEYAENEVSDLGTHTVDARGVEILLTATDLYGNSDSCIAVVRIEDNIAPEIVCLPDTILDTDLGTCNYTVVGNELDATFTDNCSDGNITNDYNNAASLDGAIFDQGDTLVTWTVDDGNGQVVSCSMTITVEDNEAPEVNCLSLDVQLDAFGNGSIDIDDIDGDSTDNCGIASVVLSEMNFDCSDIGGDLDSLIISEYVDGTQNDCIEIYNGTGNTVNLITDNYSLRIYTDGSSSASQPGSFDIPLAAIIPNDNVFVICFNTLGVDNNIVDQYDGFQFDGNDAIALVKNGNAVDVIGEIGTNPGSGWSSGGVSTSGTTLIRNIDVLQANINSFVPNLASEWTQLPQDTFGNLGNHDIEIVDLANNVILTVTDTSGNVSTCEGNVTVIDSVAPVVICQDIEVSLLADGTLTVDPSQVDNGSNDACGIASLELDVTDFDCSNVGSNPVVLTVTDVNGNSASCNATITIIDDTPPNVITQDITVQLDENGDVSITANQVDNGSNDACGLDTISVSPSTFDCSNIGDNTVILTVTDLNGNIATGTATVTVEDMVNPIAVCNPITIYLNPDGTYTLSQADLDAIADGSTDNCDMDLTYNVSPNIFTCAEEGDNIVTLTVTDDYGNTDTCTTTVTVDGIFPEVTISQSELPEFCQGAVVVLTANSDDAVEYLWNSGEETASIEVGSNGIYGVLVTSATNCTAYAEFEVAGFDPGALAAAYTIIAQDEVFLHGSNLVQTGGVGAMNPNSGNIKLHQATTVVGFGQAPSFDLNQGSTIGSQVFAAANPTIPGFVFNTLSNGSSPDVTVNNNQTQTLNGSVYDVVTVKQNATVIFSQSNVYINELKTFDGASIEFENCANVFINEKFMLAQNGTINADDPNKIVFYVNEDVQIEKGSDVRASIHVYNHELLVKGNQNGDPTFMTGLFIANRVHGNKNVIWNADDLCDPCPVDQPISGGTDVTDNDNMRMGIEMEISAWPNPSNSYFNLKLKTAISTENVEVEVFDMNNRLVHKDNFKYNGTHIFGDKLEGGVYIVKVTQSGKEQSVRLVRY